jgi:hypothetical protein
MTGKKIENRGEILIIVNYVLGASDTVIIAEEFSI